MKLYRIYTEHKPNLVPLLDKYLDGYTYTQAFGRWKGCNEFTAIVDIALPNEDYRSRLNELISAIIVECEQKSVMLVLPSGVVAFLERGQTL